MDHLFILSECFLLWFSTPEDSGRNIFTDKCRQGLSRARVVQIWTQMNWIWKKVIPSDLSQDEVGKEENLIKRIVRRARLEILYPDICTAGLEIIWYLMQFLFTSFDNRDIFIFSIWTTPAGHHLGYEEYMRKNFLVTITFPLLVNVANIYFFFKVIMPQDIGDLTYRQRAPITFILRGLGIFEKLGSDNNRWPHFFDILTPFFYILTPIFYMNRIWPALSNRCGDYWAALTKREKWLGLGSTEGTWLRLGKIPFICCLGGSVPCTSAS